METEDRHMRVLFIHPEGLGDMVILTLAITSLKISYPQVEIGLIVYSNTVAEVLRDSEFCKEMFVFDHINASLFQKIRFILKIRTTFKPDVCVVTTGLSPKLAEPFSWLLGARIRVGNYSVWPLFGYTHSLPETLEMHKHKAEANLMLVKTVFPESDNGYLFFHIDKVSEKEAYDLWEKNNLVGRNVLGIHPGGYQPKKKTIYPPSYYLKVIRKFLQEIPNSKCVVFMGAGEMELVNYFENNEGICVFKGLHIKKVAALIKKCSIFLNADSGLGHVAAAVNVPVVTIFGPGNPGRVRPYGKNVLVVRHDPILPCMPCIDNRKDYSCDKRTCLTELSPKEVFTAVRNLWASVYYARG
jgi:heptosyltransferase-2